jgi:hypothetical protein
LYPTKHSKLVFFVGGRFFRATLLAFLISIVSFFIPLLLSLVIDAFKYKYFSLVPIFEQITGIISGLNNITKSGINQFIPSMSCMWVFWLASMINFFPIKSPGLLRSLIFVGLLTLTCLIILNSVPDPFPDDDVNYLTVDRIAIRNLVILFSVPTFITVIVLAYQGNEMISRSPKD